MPAEIRFRGEPLDLVGGGTFPLVLSRQVTGQVSLDNVRGFSSFTFKLPLTLHNQRVLGITFNNEFVNFFKEPFIVDLLNDGTLIAAGCQLFIVKLNRTEIECFLVSSIGSLKVLIQNKTLNELDLGEIDPYFGWATQEARNALFDPTSPDPQWTLGCIFPYLAYKRPFVPNQWEATPELRLEATKYVPNADGFDALGNITWTSPPPPIFGSTTYRLGYKGEGNGYLTQEDRPPAVFLSWIVYRIFETNGFEIFSEFLNTDIKNDVLAFSSEFEPRMWPLFMCFMFQTQIFVGASVPSFSPFLQFIDQNGVIRPGDALIPNSVPSVSVPTTDFGQRWATFEHLPTSPTFLRPRSIWYYEVPETGRYEFTCGGTLTFAINGIAPGTEYQLLIVRNNFPINTSVRIPVTHNGTGYVADGVNVLGVGLNTFVAGLTSETTVLFTTGTIEFDAERGDRITAYVVARTTPISVEIVELDITTRIQRVNPYPFRLNHFVPAVGQLDLITWLVNKYDLLIGIDFESKRVFLENRDRFFGSRHDALDLEKRGVVRDYDIVPSVVPKREEFRHKIVFDSGVLTRNPEAEQVKSETGILLPYDSDYTYKTLDQEIVRIELIDSPVEQIRLVSEQKSGNFTTPTRIILGRPSNPIDPPILVPNLMQVKTLNTAPNDIPEMSWLIGVRHLRITGRYVGSYGFKFNVREYTTTPSPDYVINSYNTLFRFSDWVDTLAISAVVKTFHATRRLDLEEGHGVECEAYLAPTDLKFLSGRYLFRIGNVFYTLVSYEGFSPVNPSKVKLKLASKVLG